MTLILKDLSAKVFMGLMGIGDVNELKPGDPRLALIPIAYSCAVSRALAVSSAEFTAGGEWFKKPHTAKEIDSFDFWFEVEAALCWHGNAYLLPLTDGSLFWLPPNVVTVEVDDVRKVPVKYKVGEDEFDAVNVIHLRRWNPGTPVEGVGNTTVSLTALNTDRFAAIATKTFWQQGGRPLGLLTTDQRLEKGQMSKLETWWRNLMGGPEKAFKVGFLGGGFKWQAINFAPGELAVPEIREQDRLDVCQSFLVPPEIVGTRAANYATMREARMQFLENVIVGELRAYQRVFNKVIPGLNLKFDEDSLPGLDRLRKAHEDSAWRRD